MKTELALLLTHDGPTMTLEEVADLMEIGPRSLENQIYAERCPIPMFKVGNKFKAHIADVAAYIDAQRAAARKAMGKDEDAANEQRHAA